MEVLEINKTVIKKTHGSFVCWFSRCHQQKTKQSIYFFCLLHSRPLPKKSPTSSLKDLAKKQELIELKVQEQEKTFERIIMNMESGPYLCAFAKND